MIIRCCDKPELMRPGMKVQILTNADHKALNNHSLTAAWDTNAEHRFCNKTLTLTPKAIENIKLLKTVCMSSFPEFVGDNWRMHYADFKFELIQKTVEIPIYQCLRINIQDHSIMHIALSKNKEQINKLKALNEKNNKNPDIIYQVINFELTETQEVPAQ